MATQNLLYKRWYEINDKIKIYIPYVGEIIDDEDDYYSLVQAITAMPIDLMAQLDDIGIDFTEITDYDLFLLLFEGMKRQDTSKVFGDLDLSKFDIAINTDNQTVILYDEENDIVIDKAIFRNIAGILRKLHHFEKNRRKPANEEAKKYLLERARTKLKSQKRRKSESQLEPLIIAMVNTKEFKYDFEGAKGLTIYQFNESVRQVVKKVDYDNRMTGIYTGNINPKELKPSELTWLSNDK